MKIRYKYIALRKQTRNLYLYQHIYTYSTNYCLGINYFH